MRPRAGIAPNRATAEAATRSPTARSVSRTSASRRRRFARTAESSAMTSTSSKKRSSGGPSSAPTASAPLEVAGLRRAARSPRSTRSSVSQTSRSAGSGEQARVDRGRPRPPRAARSACTRCAAPRAARGRTRPARSRAAPRRPARSRAEPRAARTNSTGTSSRLSSRSATKSATSSGWKSSTSSAPCLTSRLWLRATNSRDLEPQLALERQPAQADRRAPQRVRVARAGRPLAERERNRQRVHLVGGGQSLAGLGRRQRPARRIREVLLLDRGRDPLREARQTRVLAADVALQLGELADELGGLVGLREPRRLARRVAAAERVDQVEQPVALVGECARTADEDDRAEPLVQALDADGDGRART